MKRFLVVFVLFTPICMRAATPTISDSLDILHTTVHLEITDYAGKTINGYAELEVQAKVDGMDLLPLDLMTLTVDSVWMDGVSTAFTHAGELLSIPLTPAMNTGDTRTFRIFYGGEPDQDASWGGWYWSGDYSYQMGVGFDADPHNFGRIWFPCFDNFIERSSFTFEIITPSGYKAFCGGTLESESDNGDGTTTWIWQLPQPIPSYLASVAVSTYSTVAWQHTGIASDYPVQLGVKPSDSTKMKNSFINLDAAIEAFENAYGPYRWDRVGFTVVPFFGGAMEHATNIAYPSFAVDNTLTWETLYAHELSHMWWGDLITCSDQSEMWLNEGWASFSEYLFTEALYGRKAYEDMVKEQHLEIIHYGFARDGGNYFPLAEMPHEYTYGFTTYTRGAMTVHNLRGYMGDELFFSCITEFLDEYAFQPVTSEQFRDHLSECSGIDMTPFFDGWIFQAGTPAVEVDYFSYTADDLGICIEQKLNHAPDYFTNYPIEVSLVNKQGHTLYAETVHANGPNDEVHINAPALDSFYVVLDRNNLIADAVTADEIFLTTTGEYNLEYGLMDINVQSLNQDTDWIRVEHYWVGADTYKEPVTGLHVHTQRYWRILGGYNGQQTSATIRFNGTISTSGGYLENEFMTTSDDSLLLLYRADPQDEWSIYTYYLLDVWGNHTDKRGAFELSQLLPGEYAIGQYDHSIADDQADSDLCALTTGSAEPGNTDWKLFPNPSNGMFYAIIPASLTARVFDPHGRQIGTMKKQDGIFQADLREGTSGLYLVTLEDSDGRFLDAQKVLIIR